MSKTLDVRRLGRREYGPCLALMRALVEERARGSIEDTLLLVEHEPVYTAGRRRAEQDVLQDELEVVAVERGGRVTYHGPGQVVAYPIVKLEGARRDLHAWLRLLEDVMIDCLGAFGLSGTRDPMGTGVFVGGRKIGSIGIAVKRWVTFHGLALNVATDLAAFTAIRPCGFEPELMTSLAEEIGSRRVPSLDEVGDRIVEAFRSRLEE